VRNRLGTGDRLARNRGRAHAGKGTGKHTVFEDDNDSSADSELDWSEGGESSAKPQYNKKRLRDADDFNRKRAHSSSKSSPGDDQEYAGRRKRQKMRVIDDEKQRKSPGGKFAPQGFHGKKDHQQQGSGGGAPHFTVTLNKTKKGSGGGAPMFKRPGGHVNNGNGRNRGR
jgi:hypothetical protein